MSLPFGDNVEVKYPQEVIEELALGKKKSNKLIIISNILLNKTAMGGRMMEPC